MTGDGIAELWSIVLDHRKRMTDAGELAARRREQQVKWMWAMLEDRMFARLQSDPALKAKLPRIEAAVADGRMTPAMAVDEIARPWACERGAATCGSCPADEPRT